MELVVLPQIFAMCVVVFWHCISRQRSCTAAVELQRSLQRVGDHVDALHLVHLVFLHTEFGES